MHFTLGKRLVLILFLGIFLVTPFAVHAQSPDPKYIWQYEEIYSISGAGDLQQKLDREVQKIIQAGHLAPFRALYGEISVHYYWFRRFETIYTLSLAYPYVSPSLQPQLLTYLQSELAQYPVWITSYGDQFLKPDQGTSRNEELNLTPQQKANETSAYEYSYANWPKLMGVYSLWLYAQNTGDWSYIDQNWSTIKSFYNNNRGETSQYYQSIAGAIAMARLASEKTTPDQAAASNAASDATAGLSAGLNFADFVTHANNTFINLSDSWLISRIYLGFVFEYLTPEVTRFINDNSALKQQAIGTANDASSFTRGETLYPMWYLAQAPHFSRWYGEGFSINYEIKNWLFPYHRWLLKDPPSQLRLYLDVPDALVGDYFYIQNLAGTIQAYGQSCWVDVRTQQAVSCDESSNTSPTPIASPAPSSTD